MNREIDFPFPLPLPFGEGEGMNHKGKGKEKKKIVLILEHWKPIFAFFSIKGISIYEFYNIYTLITIF